MTYNSRNYNEIFKMIEFCEENDFGLALHPRIGIEFYRGKAIPSLNVTTCFRRIVISGNCQSESEPVAIYVYGAIGNNTITLVDTNNYEICAGESPGQMSGSIPTQTGNINPNPFSYLWEQAPDLSGPWVPADGNNNLQFYTPPNPPPGLTVTTYYRRIVTADPPAPAACSQDTSDYIEIIVHENPVSLPGANVNIIPGQQYTFDGQANGGSGDYSYLWDDNDPVNNLFTIPEPVTIPNPTTIPLSPPPDCYTFTLTVTDNNTGCTGVDDIDICFSGNILSLTCESVYPDPVTMDQSICLDDPNPIELTAVAQGGSGTYTYIWTTPTGTDTGETIYYTNDGTCGTKHFSVEVDDGITTATCELDVEVECQSIITSPLEIFLCSGESMNYTPTGVIGDVDITEFEWNVIPDPIGCVTGFNNGSGTNPTINDQLTNSGPLCNDVSTIIYELTPIGPDPLNCPGVTSNLIVNVAPVPMVTLEADTQMVISDGPLSEAVPLSSNVASVTYYWEVVNESCGPDVVTFSDTSGSTFELPAQQFSILPTGPNTCIVTFQITPYFEITPGQQCEGVPFLYYYVIQKEPDKYNMVCPFPICEGESTTVGIDGSQPGIEYQLLQDGLPPTNPPQPTLPGNGSALNWMGIIEPGFYTVLGTNTANQVSVFMDGYCEVIVNPLPVVYEVVPTGDTCLPVIPRLNGSQLGIQYFLEVNGFDVDTLYGTGLNEFLVFDKQNIEGIYKIFAVDTATGCQQYMNDSIITHPLPEEYTIRPNGILCEGEFVWLEKSQPEVKYQLWFNESPYGNIVTGKTDSDSISFGNIYDPGIYTIHAWDTVWGCEVIYDSTIVLNANPLIYTMTPYEGCPGTEIYLNGCQPGVYYYLLFEPEEAKAIVVLDSLLCNTGPPLNFGQQFEAGTYTILAVDTTTLCSSYMIDSTVIRDAPQVFNIMPEGAGCPPQEIWLSDCEDDVIYYLYLDGNLIATDDCLDGSVNFGIHQDIGIYTIRAKKTHTSGLECWSDMNGSFEILQLPLIYTLNPGGTFCPPVELTLSGSQIDMSYILYNIPNGIVDTIYGTGGIISFGDIYIEGDYYVIAEDTVTHCQQSMADTTTILPEPIIYEVQPQSNECEPTEIILPGSQTGVFYQLYLNGSTEVGAPVSGDGNLINFGLQSLTGTYTVYAFTNTIPSCAIWMNGSTYINPLTVYTITPAGINCPGEEIFLNGSQLNINYEFYHINEMLEPEIKQINNDSALLYTNYFGIKVEFIQSIIKKNKNIIIDNSQAFYAEPINGIDTFYSPRKFFGVPDGGYLSINKKINISNADRTRIPLNLWQPHKLRYFFQTDV